MTESEVPQGNQDYGADLRKHLDALKPTNTKSLTVEERLGRLEAENRELRSLWIETESDVIQLKVRLDQGIDMKPSDQDADTKDTSSRPSSGSQDSIDTQLDEILANAEDVAHEKRLILAWHNTQLKAAIPRKQQLVLQQTKLTDYQLGYNQCRDDMQANLEKL